MTAPETLLKAAELAKPDMPWIISGNHIVAEYEDMMGDAWIIFDPHDPTKGDLAALNEALERDGWHFCFELGKFEASHLPSGKYLEAQTPADRALKCVEAMP